MEARRFVQQLLQMRRLPEQSVENALLVSTELVSNAYRHGEGAIELRVNLRGNRVRIEVVDEGHEQAPTVREEGADETGGWGLQIVDQLALRWGVFDGTTHVWADLAVA
jgi:anti-sigma regulatory factor (Ser/Thr protein kinase)